MPRYALKHKRTGKFECCAHSPEALEQRIDQVYQLWRAMQEKGSRRKLTDFMADRERVTI